MNRYVLIGGNTASSLSPKIHKIISMQSGINYDYSVMSINKNKISNIKDIKCFPTFISDKILQPELKNVFFLGDAFYSPLPTFAQGASQSIESAYELFNTLNENNLDKYFSNRIRRIKMVNRRSKLNYFIFHLSNPVIVLIRNIVLKIAVNSTKFLNKYLSKIYFRN